MAGCGRGAARPVDDASLRCSQRFPGTLLAGPTWTPLIADVPPSWRCPYVRDEASHSHDVKESLSP